jgi:hypothetical protein
MSTIVEGYSDTPTSASRIVCLIAVPALALILFGVLALQQDTPRSKPASVTSIRVTSSMRPISPLPREDGFTLYIMNSPHDERRLADLGGRGPLQDWYAVVNTPEEEAQLKTAWEHADWIRYESGLPLSRVVDLRHTPVASTLPEVVQHREEQ